MKRSGRGWRTWRSCFEGRKMGCMKQSQEGARVLIEYCAGALDPVQAAEVERHLESCTDCRELAEKRMELWEALDGWKAPQVSADFDARLYADRAGTGGAVLEAVGA